MKKLIYIALISCAAVVPLSAQVPQEPASCESVSNSGEFTKKRYSISGNWSLSSGCAEKMITFSDDFKTKGGPDLKVYLSPLSMEELESGSVQGTSLKLSVLKSNKGAQSYSIPQDIDLSKYKSVVIHCEAFSVLWGGFNLE